MLMNYHVSILGCPWKLATIVSKLAYNLLPRYIGVITQLLTKYHGHPSKYNFGDKVIIFVSKQNINSHVVHVVSLQNLFSSLENLIFPQGELIIGVLNSGPGTRNHPTALTARKLLRCTADKYRQQADQVLELGGVFSRKRGGKMEGLINNQLTN